MFMLLVIMSAGLVTLRVRKECTVKAGYEVRADVFRSFSWDFGRFEWVERPDTTTPGIKTGKLYVFPMTYDVTLYVTDPVYDDIIPPVVKTQEVTGEIGEKVTASQFIVQIEDFSKCTVRFVLEPDTSLYGTQEVKLEVTDMAGNSANVVSYLHIPNIKERVLINVNDPLPEAEDFLAEEGSEIVYVTDTIQLNTSVPGSYELEFLVDERKVSSILEIKDILAPVLVVDHAETWLNKALTPEDFADMEQTTDNSGVVQLAFAVEPDWMAVGEQPVTIIASDLAGNSVSETVRLLIKRNEVPPVLTVTDIDVTVGGTVSYKSAATYYDDTDTKEELKLEVERSDVNLDEVGSYMVTYTVTDTSGNAVSAPARVNVLEEPVVWMDETLVQKEAEEVLESILEETMTDKEKAEKIYRWVKKNIRYISESEKGNYVRAAYEGLVEQEGDCFVFAATARELLTLAEIPNLVIKKSTDNPSHYWNLVYVEDGWYHLDTTPRADNSEFLLLTDAELEKYSSSHKDSHLFDRTLYPEIK